MYGALHHYQLPLHSLRLPDSRSKHYAITALTPSRTLYGRSPRRHVLLRRWPESRPQYSDNRHRIFCKKADVPEDATTSAPKQAVEAPIPATDASPVNVSETASTGQDDSRVTLSSVFTGLFARIVALCQAILNFLTHGPAWMRRKRLKNLMQEAEANPTDASKVSACLAELNPVDPTAVIKKFWDKKYSVNEAGGVEFLKALVSTGEVAKYAQPGSAATGEDHRSFLQLLQDVRERIGSESANNTVGGSISRPLHVTATIQEQRPQGNGVLRLFNTLLGFVFSAVFLAFFWLLGTNVLRRYSAGVANNISGPSVTQSSSSAYTPKEYNKDLIPEKSAKTFKDVKGCDEAKAELEEIVEYLKNPEKFTKMGAKLPKGVLLTGPPGTGKTLLARAVAGEAGVPFFFRSGSEFEELYVGVGARRVRTLFGTAKKKAPCIVFIDEIDAIGGNRKAWENHSRKTLNQMLVEMDGFESNEGVIVMACTNIPESLDPALTRPGRFDRIVAVGLPDVKGRQQILEHYLSDKPIAPEVNAHYLAKQTPGFSGAELFNLVNEAALLAAKQHQEAITPAIMDEAKDKIMMGVQRSSLVQSLLARKMTAYHEAGHALVALNTKGANVIHKATIVPRGTALGMVRLVPDDDYNMTKLQLQAQIDVCMGGKAAEEIVFGEDQTTVGVVSDLQSATRCARNMVERFGMSEDLGPMYVDSRDVSAHLQQRVDAEVSRILHNSYNRVKDLLLEREQQLHVLATRLLDHETLSLADIQRVLGSDDVSSVAGMAEDDGLEPPAGALQDGLGSTTHDFQPEGL